MTQTIQTALNQRYDGPIPVGASVAYDAGQTWAAQVSNRRKAAWQELRRVGHLVAAENKAFYLTKSVKHLNEWKRLRKQLDWYLSSYKTWRDADLQEVA